jgi:hypothetical protein
MRTAKPCGPGIPVLMPSESAFEAQQQHPHSPQTLVVTALHQGDVASLGEAMRAFMASLIGNCRLWPLGGIGDSNHLR